jgi:hypothetical protein
LELLLSCGVWEKRGRIKGPTALKVAEEIQDKECRELL